MTQKSKGNNIKHVAYVASPSQSENIRIAISKLHGVPIQERNNVAQGWEVTHSLLHKMKLRVHLLTSIHGVTPHLRQFPVDLLVYDERGSDAPEAMSAIEQIRKEVKSFADLWGPDFLFPQSRIVTILDDYKAKNLRLSQAQRAFDLGRSHVRDVCVSPERTVHVLKWLHQLLTADFEREKKIGVALSGGGIEGFLYQLGVTFALERTLDGRRVSEADVYSGVSSGSIVSTLIAGQVSVVELIKAIHGKSEIIEPFNSSILFDIAGTNIVGRMIRESISWNGLDPTKWIKQLLRAIPTGFFKGDSLKNYMKHCLHVSGKDDSFESIQPELFIGATDMDSFEHVVFGKKPWDKIPISEAIYSSCALPLFFIPNQWSGRWYIDGQITKTCNLELVVERGCDLVFIIDPVKPLGSLVPGSVDKRGGYYSIIQTIKALVYTRFHSVLSHLTERYPQTDFIVFQPDDEVAQLMAGSPMKYRIRTQLIHLAYKQTVRQLRERHRVYRSKLLKYGMVLKDIEDIKVIEAEDARFFESLADGSVAEEV